MRRLAIGAALSLFGILFVSSVIDWWWITPQDCDALERLQQRDLGSRLGAGPIPELSPFAIGCEQRVSAVDSSPVWLMGGLYTAGLAYDGFVFRGTEYGHSGSGWLSLAVVAGGAVIAIALGSLLRPPPAVLASPAAAGPVESGAGPVVALVIGVLMVALALALRVGRDP